MRIKVSPSILSADFSCLAQEIKRVERAGADMLHVDVMDGHFVPNITIGPAVVKDIRKVTSLPLDVHLMIEHPEDYVESFLKAGSDMITFHIETITSGELRKQSLALKAKGIQVGVSLNPKTPLERIAGVLDCVDFVLVMTVNPGFGGQEFMPEVLAKIKELKGIFGGDIAVDGGINELTAQDAVRAGANVLAAGSYIFSAKDTLQAIERIRNAR
ncbi:MAG: ribulose-phosphate 3-epimerase [Candidatus Omnitrophota bacterium]